MTEKQDKKGLDKKSKGELCKDCGHELVHHHHFVRAGIKGLTDDMKESVGGYCQHSSGCSCKKFIPTSLDKKSKRECGVWGWTLIIWLLGIITIGLVCLAMMSWIK